MVFADQLLKIKRYNVHFFDLNDEKMFLFNKR